MDSSFRSKLNLELIDIPLSWSSCCLALPLINFFAGAHSFFSFSFCCDAPRRSHASAFPPLSFPCDDINLNYSFQRVVYLLVGFLSTPSTRRQRGTFSQVQRPACSSSENRRCAPESCERSRNLRDRSPSSIISSVSPSILNYKMSTSLLTRAPVLLKNRTRIDRFSDYRDTFRLPANPTFRRNLSITASGTSSAEIRFSDAAACS